ncbi:MAG: cob(I)yrinic acid a,c-diamide adenosyltransferase [Burkholderiales bacterium]|nr:MAG: cob(I)yrinic acid a,c-diamide adenosyltransferase [Burkholderiales bacterium]
MGHRLSKIYTRTGDQGTTGLGDGSRVTKDHLRIEAIGAVDELNATLGVLLAEDLPESLAQALHDVQHDLFDLGGELAVPGLAAMQDAHVARLETLLDEANAQLGPLKEFILPGGSRAAALAHVCRTVCRRAERRLVSLAQAEAVSDAARRYLNRLSDLFFVQARLLNRAAGRQDVLWEKGRNRRG